MFYAAYMNEDLRELLTEVTQASEKLGLILYQVLQEDISGVTYRPTMSGIVATDIPKRRWVAIMAGENPWKELDK